LENINLLNQSDWLNFVYDPFIIRWLDYYTGTVYETFFDDDMWLWSISSWWRYENLTWYIDPKKNFYSWVGWSIWLSRIVYLILENFKSEQNTVSDYLFLNFGETFQSIISLANKFIQDWKNIEIYPEADKLGKQFSFADKKWIPYVVILGDWEKKEWKYKIKNMKTGQEEEYKMKD
jgi:histidyl-tRNA synthetase